MNKSLFLTLMALVGICTAHERVENIDKDTKVYSFAFRESNTNENAELVGLSYNIIRTICNIMEKNCEYIVVYDARVCWDQSKSSEALNNGWWDVCVGYMQTNDRLSVYGFVAPMTQEPEIHLYVRKGDSMDTAEEVNDDANAIGFIDGYWSDTVCLEKGTSVRVGDRSRLYPSVTEAAEALENGEIDALFVPEILPEEYVGKFAIAESHPIRCARAGMSAMLRKDKVSQYLWMDEGMRKIRENGDYQWLCNMVEDDDNTQMCLED